MTIRALQAALLVLVIGVGYVAWHDLPNPALPSVSDAAELPLKRMFGSQMRYADIEVDVVEGIRIHDLRVPSVLGLTRAGTGDHPAGPVDAFAARLVEIQTDTLALASGQIALTSVRVSGATIIAHETEDGIEPDFPFTMPKQAGKSAPPPELTLEDATFYVRARAGSTRFSEGAVVVLYIERLTLRPEGGARLRLSGTVFTRQLGQDEEPVHISGAVDRDRDTLDLRLDVEHVALTQGLLDLLADDIAAPLRQDTITSGKLSVTLHGPPGGEVRLAAIEWDADMIVQVEDLPIPGLDTIEATTKKQLQELFGRGALKILVVQDTVRIDQLVTQMAGGHVQASGWVKQETGAFRIEFSIQDLELSDPAVKRALGATGAEIFAQFAPAGVVDAKGLVTRDAEGKIRWSVDVLLENASFEFIGAISPETGRREGFPYRVEQATGRIRLRPEGVFFDDIVGFHRGAEITLRGNDKRSWTGAETGRILFSDEGPDIRLTVEIINMAIDADVHAAVEGSEFAGLLDEFQISGVFDRVEVDVVSIPGVDSSAKTEVRLQLEGEQFIYAPFPLPVEDVRGVITMRRPLLPGTTGVGLHRRGRVYAFTVDGWAEGSPLRLEARIVDHENHGRLIIEGDGVPLAGVLTRTVMEAEATKDNLAHAWRWLDPRGRADVRASLPIQDDPEPLSLIATLKGASIHLDAAGAPEPVELSDLRGQLIVTGDDIRFERVTGTLSGSAMRMSGSMLGGTEGVWDLQITTDALRITPPLLAGLTHLAGPDGLFPAGVVLDPGGQLALAVHLTRRAEPEQDLGMDITIHDLDVDLRLPHAGSVHIVGREVHVTERAVHLRGITASLPGLEVEMPGATVPLGDGVLVGEFIIRMDQLALTPGLLDVLPESAATVLGTWTADRLLTTDGLRVHAPRKGPTRIEGSLSLIVPEGVPVGTGPRGTLTLAPLVISTDATGTLLGGRIQLEGFSIDVGVSLEDLEGSIHLDRLRIGAEEGGTGRLVNIRGRIEGLRVSELVAPLSWQDGIFRADPVTGLVEAGRLRGHVFLHTRAPSAYEGAIRIEGFDVGMLKDDLAPTGAPISGTGTAFMRFQNRGGSLRDLTASGFIRIRDGSLGDLPFVANIFALGASILGTDSPPQFERADVEFVLQKEVFTLKRIDLAGPLFDMPGRGTFDTTGMVDLYFTPEFIKSLAVPGVMQLPVVGPILGATLREEWLYAVRVRGDISNAEPELVPFPIFGLDFGSTFEGTGPKELPRRRVPRWFR